ncbi:hypothetical protein [Flavobacterium subsaxonicum]|uniref:CHAT domain-containing protein n=1 Tax=Flavobacterium subsaxonicum WB 4.1-42 = DSM 21790 TaxID=1121898 RepID=A0A0A2MQQ4_9FLAO|nr:hypothetical protein [Flavobacterium subsaxonicum]KGO93788.1 hypothetical protein Q766_07570 [Flavobacterium subsaxonicum WB 4.1-42 = DSM 21790]
MMKLHKSDIICIYPHDRTTFFLRRIINHLKINLGDKFYYINLKLNDRSHDDCIAAIEPLEDKLILFLGHGRSDELFGSCGDEGDNLFVNPILLLEEKKYYNRKNFIGKENAAIFKNKIVFSLSCNSNVIKNSIGEASVAQGARAFIGFGDIQTDFDFDKDLSKMEVAIFKGIVVRIIKISVLQSYLYSYTLENLVNLIKVQTNKEVYKLLLTNTRGKNKLAKELYNFKNEILIFGDTQIRLKN